MLPKVAMRGKSEKLVCDYVDDEPALLEAPFAARRGPLLWPDAWYMNNTIQLVSDWHSRPWHLHPPTPHTPTHLHTNGTPTPLPPSTRRCRLIVGSDLLWR